MKHIIGIILLGISYLGFGQLTPADEISPFSNTSDSRMYQNFIKLNASDTYVNARATTAVDTLAVHRTEINALGDSVVSTLIKADSAVITVLDYRPPHGAMNFSDSATVVALTQNVWAKMTGPYGNVFTVNDGDGITIAGDTITISVPGDYMAWFGLSFTGGPSDVFHVAIYKNGVITTWEMHRKTSNADTGNMGMPMYLDNLAVGDDISIYIRNTGDNDDATLISGQFVITMIHPR